MVVKSISSFQIECLKDLSAGQGVISCWNSEGLKDKIRVPLISAWANPLNNLCLRAHFKLELFRKEHQALYTGLEATESGLPVILENLVMMSWKKSDAAIVRYGSVGKSWTYNDRDTGQNLSFFTCKQVLIKEFIEYLSRWNQVAGLETVDFSAIPDEWLERNGSIIIPDVLKKSVPMWAADFGHILREKSRKLGHGIYQVDEAAKVMLSDLQKIIATNPTAAEKKDG